MCCSFSFAIAVFRLDFFFKRFSGSVEVICRNSCDIDSTSLLRRLLSHTCTRMKKNLFEKKSFSFIVS